MDSYGKFMELAMNPKETGAYLRQSIFYFKEQVNFDLLKATLYRNLLRAKVHVSCSDKTNWNIYHTTVFLFQVNDLPTQLEKMNELCHLPGFRHDAKLIEETGKLYKSVHVDYTKLRVLFLFSSHSNDLITLLLAYFKPS